MAKKSKSSGRMSQTDMILGLICAIFFLDTIPSVATLGWASITWNIIIGIFFFLTGSLVCAELGAAYPDDGGFAGWATRAYGNKMGARMGYLYWVCNAVWLSSNATLFVQIFQITFGIELGFGAVIALNLIVIYSMLGLLLLPSKSSTTLYNFGAIAKITIGVALVIAGAFMFTKQGTQANPFSVSEMKPTLGAAIIFIPALVYNFLGFETSAANGRMENPERDVPRGAIKNVLIVVSLYVITSAAMLWALPIGEVDITTGIMQTLHAGLGTTGVVGGIVMLLGVLYLSVLFVQGMLWVGAPCRTAAIAGDTGELPAIFLKRNKNGQPIGVIIISGILATIMTITANLLAGAGEAQSVFWAIFSTTTFMLLIPYIVNFEAYFKLKKIDTETPRPYVFPGPKWLSTILIRIAQAIAIFTCVLFVWVPGVPVDMTQLLFVVIGVTVLLALGEILLKVAERQKKRASNVPTISDVSTVAAVAAVPTVAIPMAMGESNEGESDIH